MLKPISITKSKGYFRIALFRLELFSYQYSPNGLERTQKFLCGAIKTEKSFNINTQKTTKNFCFLGFNILERQDSLDGKTLYCAGIKIKHEDFEKSFQKKYSKFVDTTHDDIYVINSNSGEAYVTLTYIISTLIKKNNSQKPLLLLTKKYHADLVKLITPELDYKILPKFTNRINKKHTTLKGHRCFILYPFEYFADVEQKIQLDKTNSTHYLDEMMKYTGLSKDELEFKPIKVPQEIEQSMLDKILTTNLNLKNFAFVAPEALSCDSNNLSSFWENVCTELQNNGLDLFFNITKHPEKFSSINFKSCNLTIAEAYALAQHAKKTISLRSGLSEILSQATNDIQIIYTKFNRSTIGDIDATKILAGFNIKKLPNMENRNITETIYRQ